MLKNSARNCIPSLSPFSGIFLWAPISQLNIAGPRRVPLPKEPNDPTAFLAKAAVLNHCSKGSAPAGRSGLIPATASARSRPRLVRELSDPLTRVIGEPVWYCCTPVNCQPPSTRAPTPFMRLPSGIAHTYDVTNLGVG